MLTVMGRPQRNCNGWTRRALLQAGGAGLLGLSLPEVLAAESNPEAAATVGTGRAKSVIFLWLQGGPPQHETFDPKPGAPAEVRGPFRPIQTNVPGIHFGELLPRTARIGLKVAF